MIDFARDEEDERPAPLTPEQQKLFDAHVWLVKRLARKRANRHIGYDDQLQHGLIGLLDAAHRFSPERGLKFWTYAARRVLGEMQEAERRGFADVIRIPRLARCERTPAEWGGFQSMRFSEMERRYTATGADRSPEFLAAPPNEPAIDAESLWLAVNRLGKQSCLILLMYYRMGKTMKAIGESLGFSESRVSQLHSEALATLRTNPRVLAEVGLEAAS